MWFSSWLRNRKSNRSTQGRAQHRPAAPRFQPRLEALEGRDVPSTLVVTNNLGYSTPGSLPYEIGAAANGDKIVFDLSQINSSTIMLGNPPGYFGAPTELIIRTNVDIEGPGADKLAITGGGGSRVFEVLPGVQATIAGLTIEGGNGSTGAYDYYQGDGEGGGIYNAGTLTLNNCTVTQNQIVFSGFGSSNGGGIYNAYKATMTLSDCTVTGNSATYGGGIENDGTLSVLYSTVTGNSAADGVNLFNQGKFSKFHSTIGH
jgi:hypothetical protein